MGGSCSPFFASKTCTIICVKRSGVLKISVRLIAHTPFPDRCVAQAARLCYSRGTAAERFAEDPGDSQVQTFLEKLSRSGHLSPFEHVSFSFGVDHISRVCSHQLVRHRLASYSQQSQRYVPMETSSVVCPPSVQAHEEAREVFERAQREAHEAYRALCLPGCPPGGCPVPSPPRF